MRQHILLFLLGFFRMVSAAVPESECNLGFQSLEIYNFKMGTSRLLVSDINRDGLDDILFVNNNASRLEILIRKTSVKTDGEIPELEDCFENKGMIVDQGLAALHVADLNNDERPDLITFGTPLGLQIRYQKKNASFGEPKRIFIKEPSEVITLQIGDLNENGCKDILVCRRDRADLHWNTQKRPFQDKKTLIFSNDQCYYGDIVDIDHDGIEDLAFYMRSKKNPLRIRYGKGDGLYGIERLVNLPPYQYARIFRGKGYVSKIGIIPRNQSVFRMYEFIEREQPVLLEAQETIPRRIGLESPSKKIVPAWVTADFDTNGYDDLFIAAPELSQLHLYSSDASGLNPEPQRIDTLSGVNRISRLSTGDILVVSKKEKLAALHLVEDLKRFPSILKTTEDVIAGCGIPSDEKIWFLCKDKKKLSLICTKPDTQKVSTFSLDLKNDPSDLMAFHLPENKTGFILFMPYDSSKMYVLDNEILKPLPSKSFRALTQSLTRSNIRLETPGDGTVLTVSKGAIARRFEWENDHYEITRQFNSKNSRGELVSSCNYKWLDGATGTLFYDRNTADIIHFNDKNIAQGRIHISEADQTIFDIVQLKNKDHDTVLLLGRTGLNEILSNGTRLTPVSEVEYVSPSENPRLRYAKIVQLGSPPRPMVALVDSANYSIELISQTNRKFNKELIFKVFLTSHFINSNQPRGTEPHDMESGDFNGDGIGDLVILCQNKLLIYLGE